MKKLLLFLFSLFFSQSVILSQIVQNGGFENWTDGNPNGWVTNNVIVPGVPQYNIVLVAQSSEVHSGSFAVKMQTVEFSPGNVVEIASMWSEFPISERYANFKGFFQFNPVIEGDSLILHIFLLNDNYISIIGSASLTIKQELSNYTELSAPITYLSSVTPNSAYIEVHVISDSLNAVGAYALIDDLTFEGIASSIEEITTNIPKGFELRQNYPNPFNPSTNIEYSIPKGSFVKLKVYDIIGNEVAILVNQYQNAGTYKVDFFSKDERNLTSGIYIARFSAGDVMKSIKMTLLK